MALIREEDVKQQSLVDIANKMMLAARTAPKGKGADSLEMLVLSGEEINKFAQTLHTLGNETNTGFYHRDANNLSEAGAVLLIGTIIKPLGLNDICQLCGFDNCQEKEKYPNTPCTFNTGDLNLAVGSAVSLAADFKVDNRVMFSLGKAAVKAKLFKQDVKIALGIPLSATSKNPFFDRPLHQ